MFFFDIKRKVAKRQLIRRIEMKKSLKMAALVIASMLVLTGCEKTKTVDSASNETSVEKSVETSVEASEASVEASVETSAASAATTELFSPAPAQVASVSLQGRSQPLLFITRRDCALPHGEARLHPVPCYGRFV